MLLLSNWRISQEKQEYSKGTILPLKSILTWQHTKAIYTLIGRLQLPLIKHPNQIELHQPPYFLFFFLQRYNADALIIQLVTRFEKQVLLQIRRKKEKKRSKSAVMLWKFGITGTITCLIYLWNTVSEANSNTSITRHRSKRTDISEINICFVQSGSSVTTLEHTANSFKTG